MTQNDKPNLFVVDGSNVATEGRSKPSLDQLNEAVAAFRDQYPNVKVTVVVDATFGHRIAKKEVNAFDKAVAANELVTPPAGAVGRGDAFILAIADKSGAGVFSNDSFQEFHGEYAWLFETGRLIGGKPVPNVGWVFVDRNPVRGRKSRESIKAAKADQNDAPPTDAKEKAQRRVRKKKAAATSSDASTEPAPSESEPPESSSESETSGRSKRRRRGSSSEGRESKSGSTGSPKSGQVNDPGAFFDFVEHHQVGARVTGVVDSYASHGAYARVGDVLIYIPLRLMADPAPTSARKVLTTGDEIDLVIVAYVPDRLSIDAALPGMAPAADAAPSGDSDDDASDSTPPKKRASRRRSKKRAASEPAAEGETPVKRSAAKKKAAKKTAAKKAPAKKKAAAKKAPAKRKAAAKKAPAKKTPAKKTPAKKKAQAKKTAAAKKAPAKKATARRRTPRKKAAAESPAPDTSS
jgi:Zc3h12a-like Ribonuclease NYN domain